MTDDTYMEGFNAGFGEAKLTQDVTEAHLRAEVARLTAERDALRAAIGSALWEYDHSREDNAEVNYEMGRILRTAYNSTTPEKTAV